MSDRLRIAVLAPPWFAVPPTGYGGIEWVVSLLADGLADAGHDVTLFASGDSQTRAKLAYVFEKAPSELIGRTFWELQHVLSCTRCTVRSPASRGECTRRSPGCRRTSG